MFLPLFLLSFQSEPCLAESNMSDISDYFRLLLTDDFLGALKFLFWTA